MRTIRLASFGFLIHGTTGHWFYGKLDKAIPGTGAMQVFSKVRYDPSRSVTIRHDIVTTRNDPS